MAAVVQSQAGNNVKSQGAGLTRYVRHSNGEITDANSDITQEVTVKVRYRSAGTLSNARCYVWSNDITSASTYTSRINAAAGNMSISIAASTTGAFEDTSNSDSVSAGDYVNGRVVTGSGGNNLSFSMMQTSYAADSNTVVKHSCGVSLFFFNGNTYQKLGGGRGAFSTNQTEVQEELVAATAGTLKNLFIYCSVRSSTKQTIVKSRVNSAAGNLTQTVTTAGEYEDTSNSDSVSATDTLNYHCDTSGSGFFHTLATISLEYETTNDSWHSTAGITGINAFKGNYRETIGGCFAAFSEEQTNDAVFQTKMYDAVDLSDLQVYIITNTASSATLDLRHNAVDSDLDINVGSSTGLLQNTSDTVSGVADDLFNYNTQVTGGDVECSIVSMLMTHPASAAATPPRVIMF